MTTNELFIMRDALDKMSAPLDASPREILECLVGVLVSEEEMGEILLEDV